MNIQEPADTDASRLDAEVCKLYIAVCRQINVADNQPRINQQGQVIVQLKAGYSPSPPAIAKLAAKLAILNHPWRVQVEQKPNNEYLILTRLDK